MSLKRTHDKISTEETMDVSDEEDAKIEGDDGQELSAEECIRRCDQFVEVSGTNSAHAASILQDCRWNVSRALFIHFGWNQLSSIIDSKPKPEETASSSNVHYTGNRLRLLSWNLDGLDSKNFNARVNRAVDVILREHCHIVLLQEVVKNSETIVRKRLEAIYDVWAPSDVDSEDYYCVILTHKATVDTQLKKPATLEVKSLVDSVMGRQLLQLQCAFQGKTLFVLTAHLESTRAYSDVRKQQLQQCWDAMTELLASHPDAMILFAGDLNLREREVTELKGVPTKFQDIWKVCGARKEASATWDPKRNYNAALHLHSRASGNNNASRFINDTRYDRMYLLQSKDNQPCRPVYFELSGLEKVPQHQCNVSDHWAILGHFDIL